LILKETEENNPFATVNFVKASGPLERHNINISPTIGYNAYDGFGLGIVTYSNLFPKENLSYFFNPSYGFSSQDLSGSFAIQKDIFFNTNKNVFLSLGIEGRQYHFESNELFDYDLKYRKFEPIVKLNFRKDVSNFSTIEYNWHSINQEIATFTPDFEVNIDNSNTFNVHQLTYRQRRRKLLFQNDLILQLQYEKYAQPFDSKGEYLKTSFEWNSKIYYANDSKFFIRLYGSYFPINSQRNSSNFADVFTRGSLALTSNGITDYEYDDYFFARTGSGNNASSQIIINDLGFKNTFDTYNSEGMSNNYAFAVNMKVDLPFSIFSFIKIRPYADMAISSTKSVTSDPLENNFYYSGGLSIELGDIGGIYLPLLNDNRLKALYSGSSLLSRFSFKLNLNKLSPWLYNSNPGRLIP